LTVQSGQIAQINYIAKANLASLEQSTSYVFYAVSSSNLGTSAILTLNFTTSKISNGVQFRLQFNQIVENLLVVNSLVLVLRVSPLRIKILTSKF